MDAKLKTLPAERQAAIWEHARDHKLQDVVTWLREDGVATSLRGVSEFLSWYQLQEQFRDDESTTEQLLEQLKKEVPGLSDAQIDELGQRTFSLLAIRRQDQAAFVEVRSARFKGEIEKEKLKLRERAEKRLGEGLELQRKKFQRETCEMFLQWAADARATRIASSTASNAEKIEKLGQLMFGDSWRSAT